MYRSGSLTTAARELARYKLNLVGYRKLGGTKGAQGILIFFMEKETTLIFFFGGATAWGGPWPPLQYASRPLDPLLCLSIRLSPSFSGSWTRHPAISFLVFLFVLLHKAFRTTSFLELRCLAFFLCDQAIILFGI